MMPPAVTVPPYNSYDEYSVIVSARHYYKYLRHQQFPEEVYMTFKVIVRYLSSDRSIEKGAFEGHYTCSNFKFPVHMLTWDDGSTPPSLSWDIISLMIDVMSIPFPLKDRLHWREEQDGGGYGVLTPLMNQEDMTKHILDYVRRMNTGAIDFAPINKQGCNTRPVVVTIEKFVTLPHHEFQAWITWADNQKRVDGVNFMREYQEVIMGRPSREIQVQSLAISDKAARSSVEALEKVIFKGGGGGGGGGGGDHDHELCPICMEEFLIGSEMTRMPCSHLYHGHCILTWLKKNRWCPYCRCKLVSASDSLLLLDIEVEVGFYGSS